MSGWRHLQPRCDLEGCSCRGNGFLLANDERRIVWCDVPKAASTSIRKAIGAGHPPPKGWRYARPANDMELGPEFLTYFKFAFTRNPFDRMASCWADFRTAGKAKELKRLFGIKDPGRMTFPDFVRRAEARRNHHWEQAATFVPLDVTWVGRFEDLQRDWRTIAPALGLGELEKLNIQRERKDYRDLYDDEARAIVARMFVVDMVRWNYRFDPSPVMGETE